MAIIVDDVVVLDVGPFEAGLEGDRFGHGSSGNLHGYLGSVRHQFSGGCPEALSASTASALLASPPATCFAASGDSAKPSWFSRRWLRMRRTRPRPLVSAVTVKFFGISNLISSGLAPAPPLRFGVAAGVTLGTTTELADGSRAL